METTMGNDMLAVMQSLAVTASCSHVVLAPTDRKLHLQRARGKHLGSDFGISSRSAQ